MNKPNQIFDAFGRPMEYLRISVTDRCNLRCFYCMPGSKIKFLPRNELLTYEELLKASSMFIELGVKKIRITGGEPFLRKDLMSFLERLRALGPELELGLTSNGVLLGSQIGDLERLGIRNVNLSLDTLDALNFKRITDRDDFDKIKQTLFDLIERDFKVKINSVIMKGVNEDEIGDLASLARDFPLEVRFIEEMPFNGTGERNGFVDYKKIRDEISKLQPGLDYQFEERSSAMIAKPENFRGKLGIIPAFTRSFCGSCNRIRLTAKGEVKTCLYSKVDLDLKALLRSGISNQEISKAIERAYAGKAKNGFESEKQAGDEKYKSMSTIGG